MVFQIILALRGITKDLPQLVVDTRLWHGRVVTLHFPGEASSPSHKIASQDLTANLTARLMQTCMDTSLGKLNLALLHPLAISTPKQRRRPKHTLETTSTWKFNPHEISLLVTVSQLPISLPLVSPLCFDGPAGSGLETAR